MSKRRLTLYGLIVCASESRSGRGRKVSALFSKLLDLSGASSCALTCSRYRGQSGQLGHGRMKATGRTISAPARQLLLNLLVEERAGTLGRRPLCRRCLRTLHSNARILQNIKTLSPARKRHDPILSCCFWHEETRRRHLATFQTRSLATVHEGTLFQAPLELEQTRQPAFNIEHICNEGSADA